MRFSISTSRSRALRISSLARRANGNGAYGERAEGECTDRDRGHADRRQRDRLEVEGDMGSAAAWHCGRAGESPKDKGKRAHVASLKRPALLYSILGLN
jgi:hypothetical protein